MAKEMTLEDIQQLTEEFADARNNMMAAGDALNVDIEAAKQAHLSTLTKAAHAAQAAMTRLHEAVDSNRYLFAAKGQKSKVWAGIKVGLQSGKPKVVALGGGAVDAKALHGLSARGAELVKVEYSVKQAALNALADMELPALKLERTEGKDSPLVKPVDEEAAKIVDALIKEFVAEN